MENSSSQRKPIEEGVERVPTRNAIFAKTAKIVRSAKNWKIRQVRENLYKKGLRGPRRELRFLLKLGILYIKSAKIWKIRRVSENLEEEVERAPIGTARFAQIAKIANVVKCAKNRKIHQVSENL